MTCSMITLDSAAGCGAQHGTGTCTCPRPWRILKSQYDPGYPWLVSRFTRDFRYEPVMRCSSFERAVALVQAMVWLASRESPAHNLILKGSPYVR